MPNPIAELAADPAALAGRLASLPWVPGVAVAGIVRGAVRVAASGVADVETGVAVEAGTRFRPGSITKLLTATLVMRCVEDGDVALDDPVVRYVPELRPADPDRASRVTIRHLLSHSSGLDAGDLFVDTGSGDDCRARYVEALADTGFLFEPGEHFSYCNAGTILAGRIVEVVRDTTWEEALRDVILAPLGMNDTTFVPGPDAASPPAMLGAARGHRVNASVVEPLPWRSDEVYTTRAMAPAGGTLVSTVGDLARLLLTHLGLVRVIDPAAAAAMRSLVVRAPGGVAQMLGAGLGWQVWHGSVRAAGANPGQSGVVALDAESGCAVVVLTNSDAGVNAIRAALDPGVPPASGERPLPLPVYSGEYVSHAGRVVVTVDGDALSARIEGYDGTAALAPVDAVTFSSASGPAAFFAPGPDGRPTLLRWRMRVARRV